VLAWLSVWSKVQTRIWPSCCHCHSLSLASVRSRLVLPFWYWLTWVVLKKGPLNVCVCVCVRVRVRVHVRSWSTFTQYFYTCGNYQKWRCVYDGMPIIWGVIAPKSYIPIKTRRKGTSLGCRLAHKMIPVAQSCAIWRNPRGNFSVFYASVHYGPTHIFQVSSKSVHIWGVITEKPFRDPKVILSVFKLVNICLELLQYELLTTVWLHFCLCLTVYKEFEGKSMLFTWIYGVVIGRLYDMFIGVYLMVWIGGHRFSVRVFTDVCTLSIHLCSSVLFKYELYLIFWIRIEYPQSFWNVNCWNFRKMSDLWMLKIWRYQPNF